jgi:DeoR/GlpR family transcriptional regulator of sugar metabolism
MVKLGHVSEIDALFTDAPPSPEIRKSLRANGVRLRVANGARAGRPPAAGRKGG